MSDPMPRAENLDESFERALDLDNHRDERNWGISSTDETVKERKITAKNGKNPCEQ